MYIYVVEASNDGGRSDFIGLRDDLRNAFDLACKQGYDSVDITMHDSSTGTELKFYGWRWSHTPDFEKCKAALRESK